MQIRLSKRNFLKILAGFSLAALSLFFFRRFEKYSESDDEKMNEKYLIEMNEPRTKGGISVEEAIKRRRSRRTFTDAPILLTEISQLCWAAQGITEPQTEFRSAPSAGALYPLEVFLVIGNSDIESGIYQYSCKEHGLICIKKGDYRNQLSNASLGQECIQNAGLNVVITAIYERSTMRYKSRGKERYVHMEAGHVAQNIYLQAESMGLGTVAIGAFYDNSVQEIISTPSEYTPIYILPVGHI